MTRQIRTLQKPPLAENDHKAVLGGVVAHSLADSEHALDAFIGQLGRGLTEMADGRRGAGLRAADCQSAFRRYANVISTAAELRGELVRTHAEFAISGRRAGVNWTAFGPTESTPDGPITDGPGG
jgi:hypothetical protein